MKILDSIAGYLGYGKVDARPQNVTYSQDVMDSFGVGQSASAGMPVTPVSAMRVAAVFACVQKIAGAIATLPIHVYSTNGDVKARLPRDELWYKLNESPSAMWTAASHWESVSANQLLRGDAYALIDRGLNNSIRQMLPLPNGIVSVQRETDGSVRYYLNLTEFGMGMKWVDPFDILHFPGFGFDGLRSMSVISYAAKNAVGNALAMDDYSGKFFANGAHPSMILTAAGKMNPEQVAALQSAFVSKYSGSDNAHRIPLVLTEGLDAKNISINADDAQLLEARKFQVIDIARAFGVPPHLIGETSASTSWGSGIEAMSRGFVTYTLQPHLVRIEQELNRKLFPRNTGRFVQFDRDALIEGDSAAQAAYNRAALGGPGTGMGWLSVDEVRKTKGLAPMGGVYSEVFDPRTMQPEAAPADTSKQDAAVANLVAEVRETRHRNEVDSTYIKAKLESAPVAQPVNTGGVVVSLNTREMEETFRGAVDNIAQHAFDRIEQMAPVINVAAPVVNVEQPVINVAAPIVNFEAVMPAQSAPIINVAPAPVVVSLPSRKTETIIQRDADGNIVRASQLEQDA